MVHRHALTWVALFALIGLMFLRLPQMAARQDTVINTYNALVEVDALVKQKFVEPVDPGQLVDGAIRGVLLKLDPYSGYIAPEELPAFQRRSRGNYCGLGIVLGMRHGRMTVIAPIEGSPAARAGIRPGDVLMAADGRDVSDRSVFDVDEMLVGQPGTTATLRVLHPGAHEPIDLVVTRGRVTLPSVRGFARARAGDAGGTWNYMADPANRIGYIRISSFRRNTMREFDRVLTNLRNRGLRALVLDLRFNPGGHMHQAVALVDRFIPDGLIVSTVNRYGAVERHHATAQGTVEDVRLAVLVNAASASASEIVAGALQARRRAVVVGERTFGKGSVQHVVLLTDHKAAVKLTVAYYRLPDGRIIHRSARLGESDEWGVSPDVPVVLSDDELHDVRTCRHELDLAFTVEGDPPPPDAPTPCVQTRQVLHDRQLQRAMQLLREDTAAAPDS